MPITPPSAVPTNAFSRVGVMYDRVRGERYHFLRIRESLPPADDDTTFEWRAGARLERVANAAWGTPELWWLLVDVNDLVDEWTIPVGTLLRVPSRTRVERLLSTPSPRPRG